MLKTIKEYSILTGATGIVAIAVFFFMLPSHAAISSISALAMVLQNLIPLPVGILALIMNAILLAIGFLFLGKEFGTKTIYTSLLLPTMLAILEWLCPKQGSLTNSDILDVGAYIFVVSIGCSILFHHNASSGGVDIIGKLMQKYLGMELGKAIGLAGIVICASTFFFYSSRTVVLSFLGTYLNGIVLDHFLFGKTIKKRVCIVSANPDPLRQYIVHTLNSGATIYAVKGAYHLDAKEEIITIVDAKEYRDLSKWIAKNDPYAFVTVTNLADLRYVPKPRP